MVMGSASYRSRRQSLRGTGSYRRNPGKRDRAVPARPRLPLILVLGGLALGGLGIGGCELLQNSPYPGFLALAERAASVTRQSAGAVSISLVTPTVGGVEREYLVILEEGAGSEPRARFYDSELQEAFSLNSFQFRNPQDWLGLPDGRIWAGDRYLDAETGTITGDEARINAGGTTVVVPTDGGIGLFSLRLDTSPGNIELLAEPLALFLESGPVETADVTLPAKLGGERVLVADLDQLAADSELYPDNETFTFNASIAGAHGAVVGDVAVLQAYVNLGDRDTLARISVPMPFSTLPASPPADGYPVDYFRIGREAIEGSLQRLGDLLLVSDQDSPAGLRLSVFELQPAEPGVAVSVVPLDERSVDTLFGPQSDNLDELDRRVAVRPDGTAWFTWDPGSEMLFRLSPWWESQ